MNRILSILVQDIQKLEKVFENDSNLIHVHVLPFQGVTINGIDWPVKGTIAVCSADNLGSQELGGFKLGGASFRVCRHCLGTESDIQTLVKYIVC